MWTFVHAARSGRKKCHAVLWEQIKTADMMALKITVCYIFLFNTLCMIRCSLLNYHLTVRRMENEIMSCIVVF